MKIHNRSQEIKDKLGKANKKKPNNKEYWRIIESLNKQMKEVRRQFIIKNAKSHKSAKETVLTC